MQMAACDAYADQMVDHMFAQMPNLCRSMGGRTVISPSDLAQLNIHLAGGDRFAGGCGLDQLLLWRPLPGTRDHETPVQKL